MDNESIKLNLTERGYVFDEETGCFAVTEPFMAQLMKNSGYRIETLPVEPWRKKDASTDDLTKKQRLELLEGQVEGLLRRVDWIQEASASAQNRVEEKISGLENLTGSMRRKVNNLMAGGVVKSETHPMDSVTGQVGPSGDDEPFDSWAGRQIGKLSKIVNDEVLGGMARRISRMEERMTAFTMNDDSEFRVALRDVESLKEAYENTHEAFERKVMEFSARLASYGVPEHGSVVTHGEMYRSPAEKVRDAAAAMRSNSKL